MEVAGTASVQVVADLDQLVAGLADGRAKTEQFARETNRTFAQGVKSIDAMAASARAYGGELQKVSAVQERINATTGVRDPASAAGVTKARAADIAAYAREIETLERKYAPLVVVERQHRETLDEISMAVRTGVINEEQRGEAVARATNAYNAQVRVIKDSTKAVQSNGRAAALSTAQLGNLTMQVNDLATMAAMGAPPLQILTSQVGQIYQVLSQGEGGTGGSLRYLRDVVVGLVTPLRLAAGGAAAFGAATLLAFNNAQRNAIATEIALSGVGRASGATADQIYGIADAAAIAGQNTVGGAREIALALVATGKVSASVSAQAVELSRSFAKTFGDDNTEAAARFARVLADPAKGIDDLNRRLGSFDDRTQQVIKSLVAQNRLFEAQELVLGGIRKGVVDGTQATSIWERAWNGVADTASRYWDQFSRMVDRAAGGGTLVEQLADAQQRLRDNWNGGIFGAGVAEKARADIARITAEMERQAAASAETKANLESVRIGDLARSIAPETAELKRQADQLKSLRDGLSNPSVVSHLDADTLKTAEKSIQLLQGKIQYHKTAIELQREENAFALQGIEARTVAQRAELAYRQTLARANREDYSTAVERAEMARARVLKEADAEWALAIRQRNFNQQMTIDQLKLDASLVGKSTVEAAGLRAEWEAIADAKRRAFERGEALSPGQDMAVRRDAQAYGAAVRTNTSAIEGFNALEGYKTEEQAEADHYARRLQLLDEFGKAVGVKTYELAALREQIELEHQLNIERMYAKTASQVANTLDAIGGALDGSSKEQFKIQKALSIASAVLKGYESAVSSYAAGAAIGGPPLGAVYAGLAVAQTAAMIAKVQSAQFTGGGRASVPSAPAPLSGRGASSTSDSSAGSTQQLQPQQQQVHITLQGSRYTREEVRELIESINDAQRDGIKLVVSNS